MSLKNHKNVGVQNGLLNPCPNLFNCVCSQYPRPKRYYEPPWKYIGTLSMAMDILTNVLSNDSQINVKERTGNYIHLEATVPLFGFIDDVEFLFLEGKMEIHFRSASRLGTWDLGLNKLRLKRIKKKLNHAGLEVL